MLRFQVSDGSVSFHTDVYGELFKTNFRHKAFYLAHCIFKNLLTIIDKDGDDIAYKCAHDEIIVECFWNQLEKFSYSKISSFFPASKCEISNAALSAHNTILISLRARHHATIATFFERFM